MTKADTKHKPEDFLNDDMISSSFGKLSLYSFPFYLFEGAIAFTGSDCKRVEIPPSTFVNLSQQAFKELPYSPDLVSTRLRQLAGDRLEFGETINLIAAYIAKDDKSLQGKLTRFLSIDIIFNPNSQSSPHWLNQIFTEPEIKKIADFRRKALGQLKAVAPEGMTNLSPLIGEAKIAAIRVMTEFISEVATILAYRLPK